MDEYYHYFAPQRIVPSIRTPTLFLVAKDDPFLGETEQCEVAIRGSGHVSLAHVRKGGHVAFLEKGVGVFGPCWTDKVLGEFLASDAGAEERCGECGGEFVEAARVGQRAANRPDGV